MVLVACAASVSLGLESNEKLRNEIFGAKAARKIGEGEQKKERGGRGKKKRSFLSSPPLTKTAKKSRSSVFLCSPIPRKRLLCTAGYSSWRGADDSYVNPLSGYLLVSCPFPQFIYVNKSCFEKNNFRIRTSKEPRQSLCILKSLA